MSSGLSVVLVGATGAVGSQVARALAFMPEVESLTLLGRRPLEGVAGPQVHQHHIDIFDSATYRARLPGHQAAICTLGVGQPSKISKADFVRIDQVACLDFAARCKEAGVEHFTLLGSVGANPQSRSFYLRTKGELENGLKALDFDRLSLFQPSMILTPTNRYGWAQAITLGVWPRLNPILIGGLRKYRGIRVDRLGTAIARSVVTPGKGVESLTWEAIEAQAQSR